MSVPTHDVHDDARAPMLARVVAADRRADARLTSAIDDFFLGEDGRLDDRTRAAIAALVSATVATAEREIAGHAARRLGADAPAGLAPGQGGEVLPRLIESGLLRDRALMGELLGEVRQDLLGEALVAARPPGFVPSLLARLGACGDGVVEAAATDYMLADSRRRAPTATRRTDLPAELHHRIVWWVAAALRERHAVAASRQAALDGALADAATRSLSAHDESDRLEVVAARLAAAIDARPDELGTLLVDALAEGLAALFVAAVAHALGIDPVEARDMVLDVDGDRLWIAFRALGLDRETIARLGLALADADPRRDIESFADRLDAIASVPVETARPLLAPLALPRDFRLAVRALARGPLK